MSCGVRKVADGRVLRARSYRKESQKDLVRPSSGAIKWQKKFRAEKRKVILMEKAALFPRLVSCWGRACFVSELTNR